MCMKKRSAGHTDLAGACCVYLTLARIISILPTPLFLDQDLDLILISIRLRNLDTFAVIREGSKGKAVSCIGTGVQSTGTLTYGQRVRGLMML